MTCPASDSTWKKAAVEGRLRDTCSITEPGAQTIGSGGGVVAGTPVTTAGVACRIVSLGSGGGIYEVAMRLQLQAPMVFYFATSQTISDFADLTSGGFLYKVSWVQPVTAQSVLKVVLVDKIT